VSVFTIHRPADVSSASSCRYAACINTNSASQAAADGDEPAPKKKRKDRGDKGEKGSSRPQRLRRQRADSPDAGGGRQAAAAQWEEVPEDQREETAADQDFIDDDGEQYHA
jgi:hypothetical protein